MNDTQILTIAGKPQTLADRFAAWRVRMVLRAYSAWLWLRGVARVGSMKSLLALGFLGAITAFALMVIYVPEFSGFAAPAIRMVLGVTTFYIIDKVGFSEISTIDHLHADPRAYADHLRSYALVVAACSISPFGAG